MKIEITLQKDEKKAAKILKKVFELDDERLEQFLRADDMALAIWDILGCLRSHRKYNSKKYSAKILDAICDVEEEILDIVRNRRIDIDELVS